MEMKAILHRPVSAANAVPMTIALSEADPTLIRWLEKQGFGMPTAEVVEATTPEAVIAALSEEAPKKSLKKTAKKAS